MEPQSTPDDNKETVVLVSEMFGTAFFIINFMIHTDPKTRFSDDKSINSMIIAASYVAARHISGGGFLTGIP